MEFFKVLEQRYSVREYRDQPVEETAVCAILDAANDAPSAGNRQAYEIVVIRDAGRKQQLVKAAYDQGFIAQASVVLVFLANPERNRERYGQRGAELYSVQDATIACAHAHLAAAALGLGSCWIGAFDDAAVHQIAAPSTSWQPVAVLPIGHPAEPARPRLRRPLNDLVHE